jgi:hypothetical protein
MSVGVRSRTSAAVSPFGRSTCFCHDALNHTYFIAKFTERWERDEHIGLSDDIATFWGDHYALTELVATGIIHGLQHAPWNAGGTFYAGPVIELTIVVGWTIMYPVTLETVRMKFVAI